LFVVMMHSRGRELETPRYVWRRKGSPELAARTSPALPAAP
jgi:hypothetical protein